MNSKTVDELFNAMQQNEEKRECLKLDKDKFYMFFTHLLKAMFLDFYQEYYTKNDIDRQIDKSMLSLKEAFKENYASYENKFKKIYAKLNDLRSDLLLDVKEIYDYDPAANSYTEIITTYPGFFAIATYRIAHEFYLLDLKFPARALTEHAHSLTGIDINPGAQIGKSFFIDHGTGVVIGETTIIGNHVKIYQGVTLGALSLKDGHKLEGQKRHPTIEDNVTIYSGASILGGKTIIGHDSTIGSNVFIVKSVPPHQTIKKSMC